MSSADSLLGNKFDPDQARQNIRPDLDKNMFDTLVIFLKDLFLENSNFEKNISRQQGIINMINYSLDKVSMNS